MQRISRICKCLGEFHLDRLVAPFLLFVLAEQSEHQQLNNQGLKVCAESDAAEVGDIDPVKSSMDRWCVDARPACHRLLRPA